MARNSPRNRPWVGHLLGPRHQLLEQLVQREARHVREAQRGRRPISRVGSFGSGVHGPPSPELQRRGGAALSISAVARQTGISVATLRVWQSRYGMGPSLTTPGGHRRYTTGDVGRLEQVLVLRSEGLTTGEAVHAVLAASRSELGLPPDADPAAHHLGAAALELDGPTARRIVHEHLRRGDVAATWEAVLRPVLGAIGDRWAQLRHGIAVEHLLSHVAVELLGSHRPGFGAPAPVAAARRVGLACVPGELHDLPLVVLDAALTAAGIGATRLKAPTHGPTLDTAIARHPRPVLALHALTPEPADPALFDRAPSACPSSRWDRAGNPTPSPATSCTSTPWARRLTA